MTVILVSCVAAKASTPAPARELYRSPWFVKARALVERTGLPWFVLSAEHGLVDPDQVIAPYNRTLNAMTAAERAAWSRQVGDALFDRVPQLDRVVFLAGEHYRRHLAMRCLHRGIAVEVPMQGLGIGQQLYFLTRAQVLNTG